MVFAGVRQVGNRVIVKFENSPGCVADVQQYLDKLKIIYDAQKPFIILYDASCIGWLSWEHIMLQADFMKDMEGATKHLMKRAAIVVSGSVARGLLKALFAIVKPACPLEIFNNVKDARTYLKATSLQPSS
jgi:hypothetical protein